MRDERWEEDSREGQGMKRRREEATTTTAVLDNDNEITGKKERGGD